MEGAHTRIQRSPPLEQVLHEVPVEVARDTEPTDRAGGKGKGPNILPPLPEVVPLEVAPCHPFGFDGVIGDCVRNVDDLLASAQHPKSELGVLAPNESPAPRTDVGIKSAVPVEHYAPIGHVGSIRRPYHRTRAVEL